MKKITFLLLSATFFCLFLSQKAFAQNNPSHQGHLGDACSFVKSYIPFSYAYGFADAYALTQTANGLEASFFTQPSPSFNYISQHTTVKTDANGNFISKSTTDFGTLLLQPPYSLQSTSGDFVSIAGDFSNQPPIFRKINAAGAIVWTQNVSQYIPSVQLVPGSIVADGSGFIGIWTTWTAAGEVILVKIDANGNVQWFKRHLLGAGFSMAKLALVTADGVYGGAPSAMGFDLVKYDKTNGNIIWATPTKTDFYGFQQVVLLSDGNIGVLNRDGFDAVVSRFNATTGELLQKVKVADLLSPVPTNSFPRGMIADKDGGVIFAGGFGSITPDPNTVYQYLKLNATLGLVWTKEFPAGWNFLPKAIAADGGILFLGIKNVQNGIYGDLSILKTTANGDLTPICADACYVRDVVVKDIVCNNNGTDSNPLDDTYTFSVAVANSGNCTGGWIGAGASGGYGVASTISGGLIDADPKTFEFAHAANPASSIFSITVKPPAVCSNTATGCGYETTSSDFEGGYSTVSNAANGGIFAESTDAATGPTGFPSVTYTYTASNLDAAGTIGVMQHYSFDAPNSVTALHTDDGNFVYVDAVSASDISIKKVAPGGGILWTKKAAFAFPANAVETTASISLVTADALYFLVRYDIAGSPAPRRYHFVVKTDLNGVKISETALPTFTLDHFQYYTLQSAGADGSYLIQVIKPDESRYYLTKVAKNGVVLWSTIILGDLPSSSLKRIEETPDGQYIYVTTYSNRHSFITKLNHATGLAEINFAFPEEFKGIAPDVYLSYTAVRSSAITADGGIVTAFEYSYYAAGGFQSGYAYGKISSSGHVIWVKKDINIGDLVPSVGTPDGGVVFSGVKTPGGLWTFMKLNSLGELSPSCETILRPDLTLANINATNTSVAVGEVLGFKFDLKNNGTGAATGNFSIKSYLSKDQMLSADDLQDGMVPTGNLAAGQAILQVMGALRVPAGTPSGNYFVLLQVDAEDQIAEGNESNNVLASASTVAVTGSVPVAEPNWDNTQNIDFQVSPNPSDGILNLDLSQWTGKTGTLSVRTGLGVKVFEQKLESLKAPVQTVDLSGFSAGLYFVQVEAKGYKAVTKRVVLVQLQNR